MQSLRMGWRPLALHRLLLLGRASRRLNGIELVVRGRLKKVVVPPVQLRCPIRELPGCDDEPPLELAYQMWIQLGYNVDPSKLEDLEERKLMVERAFAWRLQQSCASLEDIMSHWMPGDVTCSEPITPIDRSDIWRPHVHVPDNALWRNR